MPNVSGSAISLLNTSANLRLDFYESGQGDTLIITFPDGGIGVVDAHPSPSASRPGILNLLAGLDLHFVCLTHPHADHGRDLVDVIAAGLNIREFWHTSSDIVPFIYRLQELPNWPSEVREYARRMAAGWANFLLDLYGAVATKNVPIHQLRAGSDPRVIAGVEIHTLAPEDSVYREFLSFWMGKAGDPTIEKPDPNAMSAVLSLRWGNSVVLLGADALIRNWHTAATRYEALELPKAVLLKVPHHGAANAYKYDRRRQNYLDLCLSGEHPCKAVLFAGDANHPHRKVYTRLHEATDLYCLANGLGKGKRSTGGLGIELPGAEPVVPITPCQPVVSFEIDRFSNVNVVAGHNCLHCPFAPTV